MKENISIALEVFIIILIILFMLNQLRARGEKVPEPAAQERQAPIPVDPSDIPKIVDYQFKWHRSCTCHDRELIQGEPVVWWPRPDLAPGAVQLYCPLSVEGMR
jgi:hypothetical protein